MKKRAVNEVITEYYEIKSGIAFTSKKEEIIKTLKKFFLEYRHSRYDRGYIIADVDFEKEITEYESKIRDISTGSHPNTLAKLLSELNLNSDQGQNLIKFCGSIEFEYEKKLGSFRDTLSTFVDRKIRKQICPNADHGLENELLIALLITSLYESLELRQGAIDFSVMSRIITDWCARNLIATQLIQGKSNGGQLFKSCWDGASAKVSAKICEYAPDEMPGIYQLSILSDGIK